MKTSPRIDHITNIRVSSNHSRSKKTKILYHITGYRDSVQFKWLFHAIYNDRDIFIIHVDKKSSEKTHAEYRECTGFRKNVVFLPSISVTWGGCDLIDTELQAIKYALNNDPDWTHIVNLSAQDYPLISPENLRKKLTESSPTNYVLCNDINNVHWRIRKRPLFKYIERNGRRFFTPIPKLKPFDLSVRWVGPWWHILTRDFCTWMISDDKARRYVEYLRDAGMPDELLIQNIIMDSPFKDKLISSCKHEIIWRYPDESISSSARPNVLTINDLQQLENSDAFFARKFDHGIDREILAFLAKKNDFTVPDAQPSEITLAS